jgi:hypothetical protein
VAKKSSLLASIESLPDGRTGKLDWWGKLEAQKPDFYADLSALVDRHIDGDQSIRRKLPTDAAFGEWMIGQLAGQGVRVSYSTVADMLRKRRRQRDGAK